MRTVFARLLSAQQCAPVALAALLSFSLVGRASAQEGRDISVESSVDKSTIRIGDVIRYSVVITRRPNIEIETPGLAANLGSFEIRDYDERKPVKQNGQIVERVDYDISTFEIGEFEIPPLAISYRAAGDTVWKSLQTEPLQIVVESIKPSEAGDIRDIKPPLDMPRDWVRTLAPWGIGALLVGLLGAGYIVYRRRKSGESLLPRRVEPPRPPHEVALSELAALRESSLLAEGAYDTFFVRLSEIIRRYLEGRFYIDAMELTTFEVLSQLRVSHDLDHEEIDLVAQFLGFCDLVKFAKYHPSEKEIEQSLSEAEEIVQRTRIVAIAQEEQADAEDEVKQTPSPVEVEQTES